MNESVVTQYKKRPPASSITEWINIYDKVANNSWCGKPDSHLIIDVAKYMPGYFRTVLIIDGKRNNKYFYGKFSWAKMRHYANQHGHMA